MSKDKQNLDYFALAITLLGENVEVDSAMLRSILAKDEHSVLYEDDEWVLVIDKAAKEVSHRKHPLCVVFHDCVGQYDSVAMMFTRINHCWRCKKEQPNKLKGMKLLFALEDTEPL